MNIFPQFCPVMLSRPWCAGHRTHAVYCGEHSLADSSKLDHSQLRNTGYHLLDKLKLHNSCHCGRYHNPQANLSPFQQQSSFRLPTQTVGRSTRLLQECIGTSSATLSLILLTSMSDVCWVPAEIPWYSWTLVVELNSVCSCLDEGESGDLGLESLELIPHNLVFLSESVDSINHLLGKLILRVSQFVLVWDSLGWPD